MSKLVLIHVDGNFDDGFTVYLQIWTEGDRQLVATAKGKLPPAKDLHTHYINWQSPYCSYVSGRSSGRISIAGGTYTSIINEIQQASQQLKHSLNDWLKPSSYFSSIREKLFQNLKDESEEIRLIVETDNSELQRLPWHLWDDFFKHYYRSEVVLSLPVKKLQVAITQEQVKVLAVFGKRESMGNSTRIKTEKDWEMLNKLLAEDSNAELILLKQPDLEKLCEQIDEHKPKILFFAGHSRSEENGASGYIDLKEEESITIDDLEPELRKAVKRGLQLAIFNSCDGFGIARQLAKFHVPNIVVMREPVPDEVAQKFLQRFLEAFAAGKPLHLAVRRAREKINRLERQFPGATWLPMTFQNPAEPPLTWQLLGGIKVSRPSNQATVSSGEEAENETGDKGSIVWLQSSVAPPTSAISSESYQSKISSPFPSFIAPTNITSSNSASPMQLNFNTFSFIDCPNPDCHKPRNPSINNFCQSCGTKLLLRQRYHIIKMLAQGGFGKTYLAKDIDRLGELCVIKQFAPQIQEIRCSTEIWTKMVELFQEEAKRLQQLGKHPQISNLLAYFEQDNELYLVQEFIDGQSIDRELQQRGVYSEDEIQEFLLDLLPILKFIHEHGVIHRDVKPTNIIRRQSDKRLVLIDFGASKQLTTEMQTQQGTLIGTPGFSPVEQLQGGEAYPASDLFALGVTCFYLLTAVSPSDAWRKHGSSWTLNWRQYLSSPISSKLAQVLDNLLKIQIEERYQSVDEVIEDITSSLKSKHIISPSKVLHKQQVAQSKSSVISNIKTIIKQLFQK